MRLLRRCFAVACAAAMVGAVGVPLAQASPAARGYLVVLRGQTAAETPQTADALANTYGGSAPDAVWKHALHGYSAEMTPAQASALSANPLVADVEPDRVAHAVAQPLPTGIDRSSLPDAAGATASTQGINGVDDARVNADIAIIDTGVEAHPDLNVVARADCRGKTCTLGSGADDNGHGTHVAGIAAGLDNSFGVVGVAPGARIWSLKVLDSGGSGQVSWIITALDWVTAHANTIDVVNMSLGCVCGSTAFSKAIEGAYNAGVTVVAAAGNNSFETCDTQGNCTQTWTDGSTFYPAADPDVISVSALADYDGVSGGLGSPTCDDWGPDDTLAQFSNAGPTVDIAAPGVCIYSTTNHNSYEFLSGTSMASPHVAGAAALLASQPAYAGHPALIRQTLLADGNDNWTDTSGDGIQEPLLDVSSPDFTPVTVPAAPLPQISVNDPLVIEPAAGQTATATFTVSLSQAPPAGETISVKAVTGNGTATAGSDYAAYPSSTLTFAPGQTVRTVSTSVFGDSTYEGNETFTLTLSSPLGAVLADSSGTATIVDPASPPPLTASVSDATVVEPTSGSANATFTVSLSAPVPAGPAVSVKVATSGGSATPNADYTPLASTTVSFAPTEQTHTVTVPVLADSLSEPNETFNVVLSAPVGVQLADATGVGTIVDPSGPIQISVSDAWNPEGDSGTSPQQFTLRLSAAPASGQTVSVHVATAKHTAVSPSDYVGLSKTITFPAGSTSQPVTVLINGDTTVENDENYYLQLTSPVGAVIADASGTGTIANDDGAAPHAAPDTVRVSDATVVEPPTGTVTVSVQVSLDTPAPTPLTVNVATTNGTATAPDDYTSVPVTQLSFAPGDQTATVPITVNSDALAEPAETFTVTLSSPSSGLAVADGQGLVTIVDPQGPIQASVGSAWVVEGDSGSTVASFPVTLSSAPAAGQTVSLTVATANVTATAGSDYDAQSQVLTFAPGETSKVVDVTVHGDTLFEGNETFQLNATKPVGLAIADSQGIGTIIDEEGPIRISVADTTVAEGDTGTTPMTFTLQLSQPPAAGQTVSVRAATTTTGTATAGTDFVVFPSTTVSFAAGSTTATVTVSVKGDTAFEPNETVMLALSSPVGATIVDSQATGTISNDDSPIQASAADASVLEGDSGLTPMTFTVSLSAAPVAGQTVSLQVQAISDTATPGVDYQSTPRTTLSFAPGQISQPVTVNVIGDTTCEPDETLTLSLSAPNNVGIVDPEATGTIINDDSCP